MMIEQGESTSINILNGKGYYTVASVRDYDNGTEYVTCSITGNELTVTAAVAGSTSVFVTDNYTGATAVLNVIVTEAPIEEHEYVDLGLPSGTLWAMCNIGASSPEEYGDYFAWGETEPKDTYSWATYKWCNGTRNTLTKYCISNGYGTIDNKDELELEDDAAYVNWGPSWRMPTLEQQKELMTKCTYAWTTINGVNGQLLTGPNGNTLFLPAAGKSNVTQCGYYWSRTIGVGSFRAYYLFLNSTKVSSVGSDRCYANTVRAVRVQ